MVEQHVLDEIGRQLDYYVDAYRKVRDFDLKLAELSEQIAVINEERQEAERLRDVAAAEVAKLAEGVPDEDARQVEELVNERLAPLIGLMVL